MYEPSRAANRLYLVLSGRVKICSTADSGAQTLLRVAGPEDFFGECSLVPSARPVRESAAAIDATQLMSWSSDDVDDRIQKEPALALALCHYFGRQNLLLRERIMTIANYKTGPRVTIALLELAHNNATSMPDGATRLTGLTHQAIADYVGTSREIVTTELNRLRRLGYVTYSRLHTDIYVSALKDWMRQQGMRVHEMGESGTMRASG